MATEDVLLDSLPYIDKEYEQPEMQQIVDRLIQDELATMPPKDYVPHWPVSIDLFSSSEMLQSEMQRIHEGRPADQLPDRSISIPDDNCKDEKQWQAALDAVQIEFEHALTTNMNLELLNKFGRQKRELSEKMCKEIENSLDADLESVKKRMTEINKKRKIDQVKAGEELRMLEQEWESAVNQLIQVQVAVNKLKTSAS